MKDKRTYKEKLLDPRWQKKRLEILQRDEWTCQFCGNKKETLHVHHKIYKSGVEPWDYNEFELLTLCASCHDEESECRQGAEAEFIEAFRLCSFSHSDLFTLSDAAKSMAFKDRTSFADLVYFLADHDMFREIAMLLFRSKGSLTDESLAAIETILKPK